MKKIIALILVLLTVIPFAVSCKKDESVDSSNSVSTDNGMFDYLPSKNYGGEEFVIHSRKSSSREFGEIEDTSEVVNYSLVQRNDAVESRFGIKIKAVLDDFNWDNNADYVTRIRTAVSASTGEFDLIAGYTAVVSKLVGEGLFYDWNSFEHVDCTNDWWLEQFNNEMTINGKCYMITGDASLTLWENMACVFFNKKLAAEYHIDDLYKLVKDGNWTYEKLKEYTSVVYTDTDKDDMQSEGDTYGLLLGRSTPIDHFMQAFNLPVTKKNAEGMPELSLMSDKFIMVAQDMVNWVNTSTNIWYVATASESAGGSITAMRDKYLKGQGLFYLGLLTDAEKVRAMDEESGILPYPKYNENQKNYYSTSRDEFSSFYCTVDVSNSEMTAIITEALCKASNEIVVPAYYEVVLKTKSSSDVESGDMIDIIRERLSFNYGFVYGPTINHIHHFLGAAIEKNAPYVKGTYAGKESQYKSSLENLLTYYKTGTAASPNT